MPYQTLIDVPTLAQHLDDRNWAVVDCRFYLNDVALGRQRYLEGHIPGAVYADLDQDLAGPPEPGRTGRHPLPDVDVFAAKLSTWGIDSSTQVVAYDDAGGALAAARLWWMLLQLGHSAAAVLDGGYPAWLRAGGATRSGNESRAPRQFTPRPRPDMALSVDDVLRVMRDPSYRLVDSRAPERYRGEQEPLYPVAGHIPGAVNAPYAENLDAEGRMLPTEVLRQRFSRLTRGVNPERLVFYCGSGVTAAHNVLAQAHAGLGLARLYVGSWSEWFQDPTRPVETGDPRAETGAA